MDHVSDRLLTIILKNKFVNISVSLRYLYNDITYCRLINLNKNRYLEV